jgi:hypothetical protein
MTADLENLLAEVSEGPWRAEFDKRTWGWADVVADRFHVGWPTRATDLSHRDFVARQSNARLIAMAPDLARQVIALTAENAVLRAKAEKLAKALKHALNFIENTEGEFGESLPCGDASRAALTEWETP